MLSHISNTESSVDTVRPECKSALYSWMSQCWWVALLGETQSPPIAATNVVCRCHCDVCTRRRERSQLKAWYIWKKLDIRWRFMADRLHTPLSNESANRTRKKPKDYARIELLSGTKTSCCHGIIQSQRVHGASFLFSLENMDFWVISVNRLAPVDCSMCFWVSGQHPVSQLVRCPIPCLAPIWTLPRSITLCVLSV